MVGVVLRLETGFIKIKWALNLIYRLCINTVSRRGLLTRERERAARFSIFNFKSSLGSSFKRIQFKFNCSCECCFIRVAPNTCRESVSSVFSIEMSHLAWIDPISLYSTTLWINTVKVNHVFEMAEMVYVEYFV